MGVGQVWQEMGDRGISYSGHHLGRRARWFDAHCGVRCVPADSWCIGFHDPSRRAYLDERGGAG